MIKRTMHMLLCGLALVGTVAHGHGENEPGPHGGEIRMPGAFHVEVVERERALRVYLLDMQFEQPRVRDSSVGASLTHDGNAIELDCRASADAPAFRCRLPEGASLERGSLIVEATRAGKPASPAEYDLPLAWSERP